MQSKHIPDWVSSPPAGHSEFLLKQISPSASERRLSQKAILFGRVEKVCHVVVNHVSASRVHAVVAFDVAGTLQLGDLGSTHGTFLDGERLGKHEHQQLHLNDSVISFGLSPLRFKLIGTEPSKASAQATATQDAATAAGSGTVTLKEEQHLGNGQISPVHPDSPHQDIAAADLQQQQHFSGAVHQQSVSSAEGNGVGEDLDARASTAALQPTHATAGLLTDADQPAAHTHKPAAAIIDRHTVGEEQDPKAWEPASSPDAATKATVHEAEQPSNNKLPKCEALPQADDHADVAAANQSSRSACSQAGRAQADAVREAQEHHDRQRKPSPKGHRASRAKRSPGSRQKAAAEAADVEDGEMLRGDSREASQAPAQKAAEAVVGGELPPGASSPGQEAPRASLGRPATGEELDPKGTTPGSASSKKAKQHPHKHAATAPVGEELDPSANKDASSPRHAKRSKGGGGPADAIAPTSSGLNRSSTQEQGTQHQQQQQQHSSPSGSDQSSGSGSGPEAQPASAHPQPSWRQQEQLEPEEEAPRAAAPLPRALSRPFSRSGSQTHTSAQAAEQDPSARFRPHHHHPSRDSHEAQPRQSALSRGLPHEPSPRHANADGVFSAADHRDRGPGHAAASRGPDRADRHSPGPERARRDRSEGGYPHYNGPQSHMDRRRPQHPQVIRDFRDSRSSRHEAHMGPDPRQSGPQPPQGPTDFRDSRPGRHDADMRSHPRLSGPPNLTHPRRPFTRDGSAPRAPGDSAGHYQNRSMDRGAEVPLPHPRAPPIRHVGPPDAHDADLSHGPAAGRGPHGNHLAEPSARVYSKPYSNGRHPDAGHPEHGRSASHGRYADRGPGSRGGPDSRLGYGSTDRRAGGSNGAEPPSARLDARGHQPSESRPRHRQSEGYSDVAPAPHRRHSSQHPSIRDSRDPPSRNERRSQGDRSPRNHRESGGRRHRSRSRSTDTGSRKRRKESGFSGEAAAAPPHVAGDPTSAAAAVMRMQGHPTGTGLSLQQKKSKLWGSKATPADTAQADSSYGSNRWDTAAFASATDKEKFSRLMGVKKAGGAAEGIPDLEDRELFSKERQDQVLGDLESQFITGLRRKDGRTVGLGL